MNRFAIKTLTLLGGVLLGAGVSYAWRRTPRLAVTPLAPGQAEDWRSSLERSDAEVQAVMDEAAAVEVELLDSDLDEGEGYDALAFDDLGAQWLARATQTSRGPVSGAHDDSRELDFSVR